jgi:vacuolar-type H+-ATPase subunit E/Vma4
MESAEQEKSALILDIEADARAEAEGILKEADARIAEKRRYTEKQIESILNEARLKAEEQAEMLRDKARSAAQREVKRRSMRRKAALVQEVMDRVEKRLTAMIHDPEYRSALVNWIAEAAIGLGAESAEVNASQEERVLIDERLLSEAMEDIRAATGGQVVLTPSSEPPLADQGIVLTAVDGRTAFNNQVKTRILRNRRRIQTLIHDCLFVENRDR